MHVVINHDPTAPGEALNIWYRVGSADEQPGATGFAHLFEHLMFTGSAQVAASEHLSLLESIGGSANATTSFDRTNYFETVPPGALDLALWLEGDRLGSLTISDESFATQREVVKEEKRQRYDNVPYGDLQDLMIELNFPQDHPYGHLPIGSMADLDAAIPDQARAFFARFYRPNNAFLTLSGPVDPQQALASVRRYLGDLDPGPVDRQPSRGLPRHEGVPTLEVTRPAPSSMVHLCWRTPAYAERDHLVVEQALAVLASGQSSRLPDLLVRQTQIADSVGAGDFSLSRGVSLAVLSARVAPGHSTEEVSEALVSEVARLCDEGPDQAEIDRINAGFDRSWLSRLASVDERADEISSMGCLLDDPGQINTLLGTIHAITAEDITAAARHWLAPEHRSVLIYNAQEAR
ncbi:M16 family metallopeptidase [Propionibacterium freudenreichii]|uniref:M16 family metallopeptidase n=1 Tax=Propionibacterium freudenreichii TaxID=1744 RepID=UPI000762C6C4|nr:pitrilysin family protein [Propionibacterium freudenreichii]